MKKTISVILAVLLLAATPTAISAAVVKRQIFYLVYVEYLPLLYRF